MKDGRQIIVAATKEVLVSLLLEESNAGTVSHSMAARAKF